MPEETSQSNAAAVRPPVRTARPPASAARPGRQTRTRKRTYGPRRKVCRLCAEKTDRIDYKQFQILRTFTLENGKMLSSRITGTCAKHQRQIARAIKRNRNIAILPYVSV